MAAVSFSTSIIRLLDVIYRFSSFTFFKVVFYFLLYAVRFEAAIGLTSCVLEKFAFNWSHFKFGLLDKN